MIFVVYLQIGHKAVFRQLGRQEIVTGRALLLIVTWPMVRTDAVLLFFFHFTNLVMQKNGMEDSHTKIVYFVALNGGWSDWSEYGPCRCETNTETRTRECNSPLPSRGALNCTGEAFEAVDCTPELCPGMYGLHRYM